MHDIIIMINDYIFGRYEFLYAFVHTHVEPCDIQIIARAHVFYVVP